MQHECAYQRQSMRPKGPPNDNRCCCWPLKRWWMEAKPRRASPIHYLFWPSPKNASAYKTWPRWCCTKRRCRHRPGLQRWWGRWRRWARRDEALCKGFQIQPCLRWPGRLKRPSPLSPTMRMTTDTGCGPWSLWQGTSGLGLWRGTWKWVKWPFKLNYYNRLCEDTVMEASIEKWTPLNVTTDNGTSRLMRPLFKANLDFSLNYTSRLIGPKGPEVFISSGVHCTVQRNLIITIRLSQH